jgi:hypothetical protein
MCTGIARLCPHPLHRCLQFGLKGAVAPELLTYIAEQGSRLLGFTSEAQHLSA